MNSFLNYSLDNKFLADASWFFPFLIILVKSFMSSISGATLAICEFQYLLTVNLLSRDISLNFSKVHIWPSLYQKNLIYVFSEMKLRSLVPNSFIHVSVSNLFFIPRIGLPIWTQQNRLTDPRNI